MLHNEQFVVVVVASETHRRTHSLLAEENDNTISDAQQNGEHFCVFQQHL